MTDIPADDPPLLPSGWNWEQSEKGMWMAVPPPPNPNEPQTMIVRFRDNASGTINNRSICRGTVAEIDTKTALRLFDYRPMGLPSHEWPASIEPATKEDLLRYEALMLEADANEQATANDPFSQEVARIGDSEAPDGPKQIVRFLEPGTFGSRSCSIGEVWPVDKERALSLLLHDPPIVELATPEELKRDRELIRDIEPSAKAHVEENRRHRIQDGIHLELPEKLIVRLVKSDRFAIHLNQGVIYEKRGADCQMYPCETGEVWEIEYGFAHILLRGKSPTAELATEADLKAYIAKLAAGIETEVKPDQRATGSETKPRKSKKRTSRGDAQEKIRGALLTHHKYNDSGNLNYEPIGRNDLASLAVVGRGSVTTFLNNRFGGLPAYERACREREPLVRKLKEMDGESRSRRQRSLPDNI